MVESKTTMLEKSLIGILSQGLTWPLEYAKTIKQFKDYNQTNIFRTVRLDYNIHGFKKIYTSMYPQVISSVPRFITRFTIYENLNNYGVNKFTSGLLAGGAEALIAMTPAETVKVKLVKNYNIKETVLDIYKKNGILGFWRGATPTIIRQSTTQGISLYTNSVLNPLLTPYLNSSTGIVTGLIGGVFAVVFNNPIDVVKTRIQDSAIKTTTIYQISSIYKSEGITGFYKGCLLRISRVAPLHALTYFFYDLISKN